MTNRLSELRGVQPLKEPTQQNVLNERTLTGTSREHLDQLRQELAFRERPTTKEVVVKRSEEASQQLAQDQQISHAVKGVSLSSPIKNHTGIEHLSEHELRVNGPYGETVTSMIKGTVVDSKFTFGKGTQVQVSSPDGSLSVYLTGLGGTVTPGIAVQAGDPLGYQSVRDGVRVAITENGVPINPGKYLKP